MPASPESASNKKNLEPGTGERILICGVNWIGDSIISMPAIQAFRAAHPSAAITMLVKRKIAPLWKMHRAPDRILCLDPGLMGTRQAIHHLKAERFEKAYILPNSFRSAFIPFAAQVPERIGFSGHFRQIMLTDIVIPSSRPDRFHQAFEYMDLLVPEQAGAKPPAPSIAPDEEALRAVSARLAPLPRPLIGFLPGAARGPSKRWPPGHFIELGQRLISEDRCGIAVMGAPGEERLCRNIAKALGTGALNLAGTLSFEEWAAALKQCDLVISNDSGGMHISAALGVPLIALFGVTDPGKTGPLGPQARILQNSLVKNRDVRRDDPEAIKSLASITPGQGYEAALESLSRTSPGRGGPTAN